MSSRLFHFSGERLGAIEWCEPNVGETLVADSWRVENGEAVAWQRHLARFSHSATTECGLDEDLVQRFFAAVRHQIPPTGAWFPRIEAAATPGEPTLRYREREAPQILETVSLAVGAGDPRTHATRKGPDLEALMALRRSVSDVGATEALILSPEGIIIEGAYSTVVVWQKDADHLSVVPRNIPRIPSVTESVIIDIAHRQGISVVHEPLRVSDLSGCEVWVLSALHGIRWATQIADGPEIATDPNRRAQWQQAWWDSRSPLS